MYLLAMGSPTHPLTAESWNAVQRNTFDYGGIRFIASYGALFIHQYLHVWTDLRNRRDRFANYVRNSVEAVRAHKTWCMLQHGRFPWIDERVWGFSACDTPAGSYAAWAAPPVMGAWDGTLAPHAAGGSLREHHPRSFARYSFVNAFRPGVNGWFDNDVIAIDLALILLMAENVRTGAVREATMQSPELQRGMAAAGFADDPECVG